MVDKVNPSLNRGAKSHEVSTVISQAGGVDGWVVPATDVYLADEDVDLTEANLNAFAESSSATSLTVTIDGGEAFVHGSWLARDTSTSVTLAASTANQTVYVGWDKSNGDTVIVGLSSAFAADDRKMALYTYDTDGSGVTSVADERETTRPTSNAGALEDADGDGYANLLDSYSGVHLDDDEPILFGTDKDFEVEYNPTTDTWRVHDRFNSKDKLRVDRGGAVEILNSQLHVGDDIKSTNGNLIYSSTSAHIPRAILQYDAVTVTAGDHLSGGGKVRLGESITLNVSDGPGSGLNADYLDGFGSSDFLKTGGDDMWGALDMNGYEILDFVPEKRSSRPSNPTVGQMIYRTDKD